MAYIGVSPQNGVRKKHTYTASGSQTSFTGAGAEGITLSYKDSNFVDVYQNGVKLAEADYTSTSGTTIVLAQGAAANDIVEIIVYDVFSTSDMVSASDGGTFAGNVAMSGTLTLTGNGDFNGDLDVDGTLETDALTINGVTLAETISDTVGAMVSGNTETGITVTYQDGDNTLDFVVGTLNQDTTGTAANATLAATVTVTDSTANTNFPIVFHDESNALLDDTGALRYNPSTGELLVPKLTVAGTTTTVDTVTMNAANAVVFEGATADAHETTLTIVDPTADRTINLPNVSGTIPVLAAASNTAITSTPAELNILDGATVVVGEINALDLGSTAVGTAIASKAVILDSNKDYTGIRNFTTTGVVTANAGVIVDNITIDGTEIDLSSGDLTLDVANNIILDANNGFIVAKKAGTTFGNIYESSGSLAFLPGSQDADIIFQGNDGGSVITALTLDMSNQGNAIFNNDIDQPNANSYIKGAGHNIIQTDSTRTYFYGGTNGVQFRTSDNAAENITFSDSGAAVFNEQGNDADFRVESDGLTHCLFVDASANAVGIGTDSPTERLVLANSSNLIKFGLDSTSHDIFSNGKTFNIGTTDGTVMRLFTNNNERLRIDDSGNVGIGTSSPTGKLTVDGGSIHLGNNGEAVVFGSDTNQNNAIFGNASSNFVATMTSGSERGRFDSSGNLTVGAAGSSISAPNPAVIIKPSGVINIGNNTGSSGFNFIELRRNGSQLGAVQQSGTTGVAYQTSSDYRLKENVAYNFDATTRLKQLKPCRFNFIAEADRTVDGFLAHEVSSVVPEAINGEKDAVDADGKIDPQQIDHSKLVPLLVKTIQELEARITALESA
jgi:hypothetical protein